jgi:hypothetical protein
MSGGSICASLSMVENSGRGSRATRVIACAIEAEGEVIVLSDDAEPGADDQQPAR